MIVEESIAIDAPPRAVIAVLTALDRYHEWNPWIVRARGEVAVGAIVRVHARLGARTMAVRHQILALDPERELRWCDHGWFTRIAYGERARVALPRGAGSAYRCTLSITGLGARLVEAMYGRALAGGLAAETAALKARVEALHATA